MERKRRVLRLPEGGALLQTYGAHLILAIVGCLMALEVWQTLKRYLDLREAIFAKKINLNEVPDGLY